ncbi:hypothetical protein PICMEDRAFT_84574 [Pichia membranifaciens NRRL Y-2026]|uniref:Uncharacterized protein n=1 Tax=Pichia membranifaciens NRRL Y-2026 TaxID=763406 RepID=A0A1E3NRC4_9ASCO|nr:hypothetical protein PICMEDRAFT_84574 [Pichia membranifaciens NRRL Y-2026]ODQ48624.1 hypothetical protein PICMEDRAFT_84574 [Pichia membranifaciens NRRL Y-2026]
MHRSIQSQMMPITELADTLSFGLVGKIRRKTHVLEDDVQLVQEKWRSQDRATELHGCEARAAAAVEDSKDTITAAYSFNDSVIRQSMRRRSGSPAASSSSATLCDSGLKRSVSMQQPSVRDGRVEQRRESLPRCSIARSLDRDMHAFRRKAGDTISSLTNSGVSISDSATDLVSGTSFSVGTGSSGTLTPSKVPTPAAKSQYPVLGSGASSSGYNSHYYAGTQLASQDAEDTDTSSISSFSTSNEFRLVLDDQIIPGVSGTASAGNPQLQRVPGASRPQEMIFLAN